VDEARLQEIETLIRLLLVSPADASELVAEVRRLRAGFASEAYIIEVQALGLAPQRLGQQRHRIHTEQVVRMRRVARGQEEPRNASQTIWDRTDSALSTDGSMLHDESKAGQPNG
jgi:hypothetical protein